MTRFTDLCCRWLGIETPPGVNASNVEFDPADDEEFSPEELDEEFFFDGIDDEHADDEATPGTMRDVQDFYFPAEPDDHFNRQQINAALDDGSLEAWRTDGDGRQWYRRRVRTIRGVQ